MLLSPLNPRITDWAGRKVWIVGASSGIGAALAQLLLAQGAEVALSARSLSGLQATAQGHADAIVLPMDASEPTQWRRRHAELARRWRGNAYWVVFCAASYRPQHAWELDSAHTEHTLLTNLASVYHGVEVVLPDLLACRDGGLLILASVAGYVGLPTATVYGPSKAALINLAELLYSELRPRGVGVYLITPGFVQTRLTARNDFPMPALQSPEQAATAILRGVARGQFEISFPKRFTRWLQLLRHLPPRLRFAIIARTIKP